MKAQEFVDGLKRCIPSDAEMDKAGLTKITRDRIVASYTIAPKQGDCLHDNPLLELVACYDVSKLEIGMVRFVGPLILKGDFWRVGVVEVDPLLLDLSSGAIYSVEMGTDHVVSQCAANGSAFLESLLLAACFLERCGIDRYLSEDYDAKLAQAEQCAEIAGGSNYFAFYEVLLGVF